MSFFSYVKRNFRFSPKTTIVCCSLAAVMLWCATWQWSRYKEKVELVETYSQHSTVAPLALPAPEATEGKFEAVMHRRIRVRGRYDLDRQMIITNRKNAEGPGYLLVAPLQLEDSKHHVLVSRGFIPFEDRSANDWRKYDVTEVVELDGVAQPPKTEGLLAPSNPDTGEGDEFARKWLYPELAKMAKQLPYPVYTQLYLQKLGGPAAGRYPEQAVRISVPPSTHYGYTIEWCILATITLAIGFILQILPKRMRPQDVEARMVEGPDAIQ